ncbi:hypothetical protein D8674_041785 [Pyrus ussuriensis x Pyrus communis]|uniref:Uncharacterized protein n=1 Tax=Pyrus ussuriensis x Pyrus communis TaxID=2448454 RepID=A0A5N5G9X3_9ROSA|nr:hypothetical protein D8674_034575 [Pyrus ussuriensis x Pyrus communis]KAB2620160.1 hypothetical protein D8674_041785 [Pyrus ussuriensis x Pyrus communis]
MVFTKKRCKLYKLVNKLKDKVYKLMNKLRMKMYKLVNKVRGNKVIPSLMYLSILKETKKEVIKKILKKTVTL